MHRLCLNVLKSPPDCWRENNHCDVPQCTTAYFRSRARIKFNLLVAVLLLTAWYSSFGAWPSTAQLKQTPPDERLNLNAVPNTAVLVTHREGVICTDFERFLSPEFLTVFVFDRLLLSQRHFNQVYTLVKSCHTAEIVVTEKALGDLHDKQLALQHALRLNPNLDDVVFWACDIFPLPQNHAFHVNASELVRRMKTMLPATALGGTPLLLENAPSTTVDFTKARIHGRAFASRTKLAKMQTVPMSDVSEFVEAHVLFLRLEQFDEAWRQRYFASQFSVEESRWLPLLLRHSGSRIFRLNRVAMLYDLRGDLQNDTACLFVAHMRMLAKHRSPFNCHVGQRQLIESWKRENHSFGLPDLCHIAHMRKYFNVQWLRSCALFRNVYDTACVETLDAALALIDHTFDGTRIRPLFSHAFVDSVEVVGDTMCFRSCSEALPLKQTMLLLLQAPPDTTDCACLIFVLAARWTHGAVARTNVSLPPWRVIFVGNPIPFRSVEQSI